MNRLPAAREYSRRAGCRPLTLAGALLLAAACGGESASSTSVVVDTLPGGIVRTMSSAPVEAGRWRLVLEREVQPPEESEGELLNPMEIQIADDGSVIAFEQSPAQLRVYDPAGTFVRAIGRTGKGPGEFQVGMLALRGDTIAVQDPMNQRVSTWNWRTGTLIAERRSTCCVWAPIGIDGNGQLWIRRMGQYPDSTVPYATAFLRTGLTGDRIDSVFTVERRDLPKPRQWELRQGDVMRMTLSVPLQPQAGEWIDPTGGVITGWMGEYSLRVSTDGVDTVALFGRTFTPVPVTGAERTALIDARIKQMLSGGPSPFDEVALRNAFTPSFIPDTRPAWDDLEIDRTGRRWVRQSLADTTRVGFDLFDRDGRWLDTLSLPSTQWPTSGYPRTAFGRDHIAVQAEGDDGRPLVRIFRIERN